MPETSNAWVWSLGAVESAESAESAQDGAGGGAVGSMVTGARNCSVHWVPSQ